MNMGKILYEISFQFDFFLLIPVFIFICGCLIYKIGNKNCKQKSKKINKSFVGFLVIGLLINIVALVTIISQIKLYNEIVAAYENGDYSTVEGYVENYSPMYSDMASEGPSVESFSINGIDFWYTDFEITQGYHNAAFRGGVITHNGQHLKLRYIATDSPNENIIVYIEELP